MRSSITTGPRKAGSTEPGSSPAATLRRLLLPGVLTLVALSLLLSLGNWQLRRLAWKEALIAEASTRPLEPVQELPAAAAWSALDVAKAEFRRYRATGRLLHDKEALVFTSLPDPRGAFGGPGYWVVTPFVLADGGTVLVNRGFAPQGRHLAVDRGEPLDSEPVTLTGILRPDETRGAFTPDDQPGTNVFFVRSTAEIAAAKQLSGPVAPFTLDLVAAETPPGGLPQAGETRMEFPNSHLQYAVTWYGLAGALVAVFGAFAVTQFRSRRQEARLTRPVPPP